MNDQYQPRNEFEVEVMKMWESWDSLFLMDSGAEWIDEDIERRGHEILDFLKVYDDEVSFECKVWVRKRILSD